MPSARTSRWIVILIAAVVPLLAWAAVRLETNTDNLKIWLPQNTPERADYDRFAELFGSNDQIILSWPGCLSTDPRLIEYVVRLHEFDQHGRLFSSISSGSSVLQELAGRKFGFSETRLQRNLTGVLFAPADQTTAVVVQLSEKGREQSRNCVNAILLAADQTDGLSRVDLRIGGESYTTVRIDDATNTALMYALPAMLLVTLVTFWSLRSVPLVLATLTTSGLSALASVALVSVCGFKFNGLMVIMPILVFVLSLSATVHLCNYLRHAERRLSPDAVAVMLRSGWQPCVLALATTSVGVAMLCVSRIEAVRLFGLFSALSLVLSLVTVLVVFPAILRCWPVFHEQRRVRAQHKPQASATGSLSVYPTSGPVNPLMPQPWMPQPWMPLTVVVVFIGLSLPLMLSMRELKTTLNPEDMFAGNNPVNRDRDWLQARFSSLNSIDVAVEFDEKAKQLYPRLTDQIWFLRSIERELAAVDHVASSFSMASICQLPTQRRSAKDMVTNDLVNDALNADRQLLINQRLLACDEHFTAWRINLGVDTENANAESVMAAIKAKCQMLSASNPRAPRVWATGIWPLATAGRNQVIRDLGSSFVLAFFIITPLIMMVLRGFVVGLLAMIPNVMPALIFFGLAGGLGIEIDVGTVLTASVGLGIAVDDTLHFLHCFSRLNGKYRCRFHSVRETIRQCAKPMIATTAICSTGLSLFAFSDFLPARNFAIAIITLLLLALICDLILLPAIILSPLGWFFERRPSTKEPAQVLVPRERVLSSAS